MYFVLSAYVVTIPISYCPTRSSKICTYVYKTMKTYFSEIHAISLTHLFPVMSKALFVMLPPRMCKYIAVYFEDQLHANVVSFGCKLLILIRHSGREH